MDTRAGVLAFPYCLKASLCTGSVLRLQRNAGELPRVNNVILDRFYGCFSDSKLPDFMFESNSFVSLVLMKFFPNNEKNVR